MDTPYYIASPEANPNLPTVSVLGPAFADSPWILDPNPMGLPPGLESTATAIKPSPMFSTIQNIWETIKNDSQSAGEWAINAVKKDYQLLKDGASTVISDVSSPVTGALDSIYWRTILIVGGLVIGIYFIAKTGAFKVNANV